MSEQRVEVNLFMEYLHGKPLHEGVPALKLGENRYQLIASPGFASGVASGDEIEILPIEQGGYRVLKRGGNICIQLFLTECNARTRVQITEIIRSIGGWLDGGKDGRAGHLVIFTIPVTAGFSAIENAMSQIAREFPVDKWMYGNVYDRDTTTPLNWWL